jgi:hypothetical protein
LIGSDSQVAGDLILIEAGARIFMYDVAALKDEAPVGDIEREAASVRDCAGGPDAPSGFRQSRGMAGVATP